MVALLKLWVYDQEEWGIDSKTMIVNGRFARIIGVKLLLAMSQMIVHLHSRLIQTEIVMKMCWSMMRWRVNVCQTW